MTITLSVALMLGVAVFLLCRHAGLKVWHATVCVGLGFYLASTSFAPEISQFTESLSDCCRNDRKKQDRFLMKITTTTCPARTGWAGHEKGPAYDQPI